MISKSPLQKPLKCLTEDFFPFVLNDCTVTNNDSIEVPIKNPFQ